MKMAAQPQTVRSRSAMSARELPLKELLALYGYTVSDPEKQSCHMAASLPAMTLDKGHATEDLFPRDEEEGSSADDLTSSVTSNTSDLLRHLQGGDKDLLVSSSDEDSDDASVPSNEEHKEIMVGSMYQAKIPPISPYTYQERAYSSDDQLLWRPGVLPVQEVEKFLLSAQQPHIQEGKAYKQKQGATVRDNEQALYELVKCNFNAEEALRRLHFNVKVFHEELCAWSEEECRNFELGYRVYGKNFHLIQANKVRTRSVGECVEYYYMWKKSDRHEYFTQQASTRLSRKKYSLQSGSMEDTDQYVEAGEMERSNNPPSLLSHSSIGRGKLESTLPPQSSLDLDKQGGGPTPSQTNSPLSLKAMTSVQTGHRKQAGPADGELVSGLSELCADRCPQQLFGCPLSLPPVQDLPDPISYCGQLRSQPSLHSSQCACEDPPSRHVAESPFPGTCFIQLHMRDGPLVSQGPDCVPAGDMTNPSLGCRWNLTHRVPHLPHLLSSHHISRRFPPCCAPPTAVQYPHSLTQ